MAAGCGPVRLRAVVQRSLKDRGCAFSLGVSGALAEFHWIGDEPVTWRDDSGLALATPCGAVAVDTGEQVTPVAVERPAGERSWSVDLVLTVPEAAARRSGRPVLTALGPDRDALAREHRDDVLFDLGIGSDFVDCCVRSPATSPLTDLLRAACGRSLLREAPEIVTAIKHANPHRVFVSAGGRIEVFQPIVSASDPERSAPGPHTHLLPELLGRRSEVPVPSGSVPVLTVHFPPCHDAASPLLDLVLERWSDPGQQRLRRRIRRAVQGGQPPWPGIGALSRGELRTLGATLRRLKAACGARGGGAWLDAWMRSYEAAAPRDCADLHPAGLG